MTGFGEAVAGAGDVDGYADVIVGAPSIGRLGRAYVFSGSASGVSTTPSSTVEGDISYGLFGYTVAGAGDVNGDGDDDVVVGEPWVGAGKAYVFHGSRAGPSSASASEAEGDSDGFDDVIAGAAAAYVGGSAAGFAWVAALAVARRRRRG